MSVALLILWAAVGWCGTPWPGWWRKPWPPPPPDPWWLIDRIVGIVGGLIGGWFFTQNWPLPQGDTAALAAAASAVGALAGSIILHDLYGFVRGGRSSQASGS